MFCNADPEQICEQVLDAIGHSAPPTNLKAVCSLWPDLRVEVEDLDKEGYLIPLGVHGAEILLRKNDPTARKKFTLAHELGHWAQAHMKGGEVSFGKGLTPYVTFRTGHKRQTPEEEWCNRFAASLLMPAKDVTSYLHGTHEGNLANRIARGHLVFRVSSEAFLKRVSDATPISVFEVVSADSRARIKRSFLSKWQQGNHGERKMRDFLDSLIESNGISEGLIDASGYDVHAHITHDSPYSRLWLVSVTPVNVSI